MKRMSTPQLLMIEDDARLAQMVGEYLTQSGFAFNHAGDGTAGLEQLQQHAPDLVILDLMLPDTDGLEICRRIRALPGPLSKVSVLMLTAKGDPMDRIIGLEIGADDYLPKPFDLDELEARIRALRRRSHGVAGQDAGLNPQEIGGLRFEPDNGAIYNRAELLELTPRELALLKALMMKPGHAVTKERLFELVFPGEANVQYEAIEVVVYRLRKKLVGTGAVLMTMRGLGYLLRPET